ncbi:MAG: flagellar biosynthesis protein FlhA [Gammaproteobacteria bacterium]|nr:flagellar biosynthesis protein FlhA [Gammaproteobacteria bacterium]
MEVLKGLFNRHGAKLGHLKGIGAPIIVVMLLSMVILPMPPMLLDIFFTFNIALSLIILLVAIYALRPMDFAVFPTILLVATLFRLSLNVASTRVVLLEGHKGPDAAGQVIQAFGDFVIGGNYAVGIIVFIILVIINFSVVTKGSGRISEVSARFTLDAMPGKQMAIDADLNAGFIDDKEARRRRKETGQEADFYGAMDGASKFVRGDAVAGIMITIINVIGGLIIGVGQHGMTVAKAGEVYVLLTIGDGLVAQIPALVLSTAAGIIVSRVSESGSMGEQIFGQLFNNVTVIWLSTAVLTLLGLVPGMPTFPFLFIASLLGLLGWYMLRTEKQRKQHESVAELLPEMTASPETKELSWDDVPMVDPIGLEVGYRLIPMVDKSQGGELMGRIKGVRKKLSQDLGFLVPPVHIRDNLELQPNGYRITLQGVTVGETTIHPDRERAINPGQVYGKVEGIKGKDPAFGLDAVWIEVGQRENAQSLGYTVVDPNTVIATHLSQVLQGHAHELLGHDEVQKLLDQLTKVTPKLAEDLVPKTLSLGTLAKVLQNLLMEGIPIRDMRTIAEAMADAAPHTQDAGILTAQARVALGRMIVQKINGSNFEMSVITLSPELEQILHQSVQGGGGSLAAIEPAMAEQLHKGLADSTLEQEMAGKPAILLTSPQLREMLARFVRNSLPGLSVLSYNEIPDDKQLKIVATVGGRA